MNKTYKVFQEIELKHDLFNLKVDDIFIWERVRFRVYRRLQGLLGSGDAQARNKVNIHTYIRGTSNLLKNIFYKNPLLCTNADILFVGHPRRKLLEDELYWDLYCDPIIDYLDRSCLCLEKPYLMNHMSPAKTGRLRYLDLFQYIFRVIQITGIKKPTVDNDIVKLIKRFRNNILSTFDVSLDPLPLVIETLLESDVLGRIYRMILQQISPDVVFLVVGYEHEVIIDACRDLGITTVELQHGTIYDGHPGYSYPKGVKKNSFPDYLFVFGDHWAESVRFPVQSDRIVTIGYPYIDMRVEKFKDFEKYDQVLFISQGTIGSQLSQIAVRLSKRLDDNTTVIYKLHPGEYGRWKEEYPWLKDSKVETIDSDSSSLYQLMAESRVQVGVGSTALFEGLSFGLQTLILDIPGNEPCLPLIRSKHAHLFRTVDELIDTMSSQKQKVQDNKFFKPNSLNRLDKWLSDTIYD